MQLHKKLSRWLNKHWQNYNIQLTIAGLLFILATVFVAIDSPLGEKFFMAGIISGLVFIIIDLSGHTWS